MKLRKVKQNKEVGYPTYASYLDNHRRELGMISAGIGLMLVTGCDNATSKTTPEDQKTSKPVVKSVNVLGDMAAPQPCKTTKDSEEKPVKIPGEIVAPTKPNKDCNTVTPEKEPVRLRGKMVAPKPAKNP